MVRGSDGCGYGARVVDRNFEYRFWVVCFGYFHTWCLRRDDSYAIRWFEILVGSS